jgi:hypothetical protein
MNKLESQLNNLTIDNLSLKYINDRIKKEICYETINKLLDKNLLNVYIETPSVNKKITQLQNILEKNNVDKENVKKIIDEYIFELIPPGTKGTVRGNMFNNIVKTHILNIGLEDDFKIEFETKSEKCPTDEIPDWYIEYNNKILIGMNQLDIWNGGQQLNRGSKYIINNSLNNKSNCKLLCVVCNKIIIKNNKNKIFKLFNIGFNKNILCYINNLTSIIHEYFDI